MAVDISKLNPLANVQIGTIGLGLLILVVSILVIAMIGGAVWFYLQRKALKYKIPLYKKIGNRVIRIAEYKAKDIKIGFAGDKLWYVPSAKKYLLPATLQTAPNEYSHFERDDGEWINVEFPDIDADMKKIGVKYLHGDMRSQRISVGNIIEQKFKGKQGFWEKYGHLITHAIFYLIVAVSMAIIFYMWGDIVDKTGAILDRVIAYENLKCPAQNGVVPALIGLFMFRRK